MGLETFYCPAQISKVSQSFSVVSVVTGELHPLHHPSCNCFRTRADQQRRGGDVGGDYLRSELDVWCGGCGGYYIIVVIVVLPVAG